ncbi:MAG: hypothetical protein KA974_07735 [Saprospiraceae bacterium]|nr:hypothetical protein [Saprospiraceae bacterium]
MNLQQAKLTLDKINHLYQTIAADADHISPIERDLILGYIRQLYEQFLPLPIKAETDIQYPKKTAVKIAPVAIETPPVAPTPKVVVPVAVSETVIIEKISVEPAHAPVIQQEVEVGHKVVEPSRAESTAQQKYNALFNFKEGNEISDKLSNAPITDLRKVIGVNDKLLYTKLLFGGESKVFEESLHSLNSFNSFQDAQNFLVRLVIERHQWLSDPKFDTARNFIKLVKRRYQ